MNYYEINIKNPHQLWALYCLFTFNYALFRRRSAPKPNKPKADDINGKAAGIGTELGGGLSMVLPTAERSSRSREVKGFGLLDKSIAIKKDPVPEYSSSLFLNMSETK